MKRNANMGFVLMVSLVVLLSGNSVDANTNEIAPENEGDPAVTSRALDQASLLAQAIKAERYDIVAALSPPSMVKALGGTTAYVNSVREALGQERIVSCTAGPILSVAALEDESFATVATETVLGGVGDKAVLRGYVLGVSSDNGKTWAFMNGSDRIRAFLQSYAADVAQRLTFPETTLTMGAGAMRYVMRDGKWVADTETFKYMREALDKAQTNR
jgi:hypothetical protein